MEELSLLKDLKEVEVEEKLTSLPLEAELALLSLSRGVCKSLKEASKRFGISEKELRKWRDSDEGKKLISFEKEEIEERFHRLKPKVVEALEDLITHPEPEVQLAAINTWIKYIKKNESNVNLNGSISIKWDMER
jgi:hypothetical protein